MLRMSGNDECPSGHFGNSLQFTNWILNYGETFHIKPQVSYLVPCSLEDMDKNIELADEYHVTAKPKVQVQIKMCDDNRDPFIAPLHNVI